MNITGKHITILGAVRSGIAAALLAKRQGAVPFVSDAGSYEKLKEEFARLEAADIEFEAGAHTEKIYEADIIVTSPGVPSDAPVLVDAFRRNIKVISELEFASLFCEATIIAITGTNGKTTTTSLCAHVLKKCGFKAHTAGNIGFAFSEIADKVGKDEFISLEISSFQLDYIDSFRPRVSMILNLTPDHLDRYENSFEKYIAAKLRIFENQGAGDSFIYNAEDKNFPAEKLTDGPSRYSFSIHEKVEKGCFPDGENICFIDEKGEEIICKVSDLSLKGEHNLMNCMAVIAAVKIAGGDNSGISAGLGDFPGVEHRLEFVRELRGVRYINDSKATNVDSVWYALRTFHEPVYLILGGKDKGNDYNQILEPVKKNVRKIYAVGSSAQKVYNFFKGITQTEIKDDLEACLAAAAKEAEPGSIVLLSPACASFDMFSSYEHRGRVFKEAAGALL